MFTSLHRFYHVFFAILSTAALAIQIAASRNNLVEFFSYFTILSNILALAVFFYLGISKKKKQTAGFNMFRGAVTLYMVITGIVYWLFLRNNPDLAAYPWINTVAHGVMPIAVFLDWVWSPPKTKLAFHDSFIWLVFPILYVVYSVVRGAMVNWYPYFFVNPERIGYEGVVLYVGGITFAAWVLSLLLIKITWWRKAA